MNIISPVLFIHMLLINLLYMIVICIGVVGFLFKILPFNLELVYNTDVILWFDRPYF